MADEQRSSLIVEVRPGEVLRIAGGVGIDVELIHKSGQVARLKVTAPRDVRVEKDCRQAKQFDPCLA
jgi:sRNA-binding carbon storage regulator CsrA